MMISYETIEKAIEKNKKEYLAYLVKYMVKHPKVYEAFKSAMKQMGA